MTKKVLVIGVIVLAVLAAAWQACSYAADSRECYSAHRIAQKLWVIKGIEDGPNGFSGLKLRLVAQRNQEIILHIPETWPEHQEMLKLPLRAKVTFGVLVNPKVIDKQIKKGKLAQGPGRYLDVQAIELP